jgi:hypothetical protein
MNCLYSRLLFAGLAGCICLAPAPTAKLEAKRLEGSWEITSVQRDGEPDRLQIGARLIFAGNEVKFLPKAREFVDGTS